MNETKKRKEKFIDRTTEIETNLITLLNDIDTEVKDCINSKEDNKLNKEYINLADARYWVTLSIQKLQIAIRLLKNERGY